MKDKKQLFKYSTSITSLCSHQYELKFPIVVVVEQYGDDDFAVSWPEVDVYGTGSFLDRALIALKENVVNIHKEFLKMSPQELGKMMLMQRQILRHAIEEKKVIIDIIAQHNSTSKKHDIYAMLVGESGYESVPGHEKYQEKDSEQEALRYACDWAEVLFSSDDLNVAKVCVTLKNESGKETYFDLNSAEEAKEKAKQYQPKDDSFLL